MKMVFDGQVYEERDAGTLFKKYLHEVLDASGMTIGLLAVKYDDVEDTVYLETQPIVGSEEYTLTKDYKSPSITVWKTNAIQLDLYEDLEWDDEKECYVDSDGNPVDEDEVIEDEIEAIAWSCEERFLESVKDVVSHIKEWMQGDTK